MQFIEPDEDAIVAFASSYPKDTPVVMLNLLKFRELAEYPTELQQEPCSGPEAFIRYGQAVAPLIEACGGEQLWQGRQAAMLIGPQDKQWHLAVLVKYPSAEAFLGMVSSAEYQKIAIHRNAALEDSRLIAHREL
jgi:uncharacterized protein (DUF1330 family)